MNTSKYSKYDLPGVTALLKTTDNAVNTTEYYLAVEKLVPKDEAAQIPSKNENNAAADNAAAKKLHTLLNRALSVVAEEDGAICGFASMDSQGNLGLLCVSGEEYKKTAKLLIRALERLAVKKQVPDIFVVPNESSRKIFKECGYLPSETGGKSFGGEGQTPLFKNVIEKIPPVEFLPEDVRRITLDGRKPISVEGAFSVFPPLFFGIACFFAALLTILGVAGKYGGNVVGYENVPMFAVIVGVIFAAALTIFILDIVRLRKLKKRILEGLVTNGVITEAYFDSYWAHSGTGDSRDDTRYVNVRLTYVFYDGNMNLCTGKFEHKYQGRAPYFYRGQEVIVAYTYGVSYLLSRYTILKEEKVS